MVGNLRPSETTVPAASGTDTSLPVATSAFSLVVAEMDSLTMAAYTRIPTARAAAVINRSAILGAEASRRSARKAGVRHRLPVPRIRPSAARTIEAVLLVDAEQRMNRAPHPHFSESVARRLVNGRQPRGAFVAPMPKPRRVLLDGWLRAGNAAGL